MRPTRPCSGFTLIEAIMVMAITGVLAAVVAMFIVKPVQGYLATSARAALVDQADLALRRIGRDLRSALPNSARVSANARALELVPASGGARYATEGAASLEFGSVDTSFALLGPPLVVTAAQELAFYNLGPGINGSDVYAASTTATEQASSNRRTASNAAGPASTVNLNSLAGLPTAAFSPPYRVVAVAQPVSYRCNLVDGTLTRYSGYGFLPTQPDPPTGGSADVLATGVSACRFAADTTLIAARAALVNLHLTLSANGGENVTLHHAVFVDNLP